MEQGFTTLGSCSGHGERGFIALDDRNTTADNRRRIESILEKHDMRDIKWVHSKPITYSSGPFKGVKVPGRGMDVTFQASDNGADDENDVENDEQNTEQATSTRGRDTKTTKYIVIPKGKKVKRKYRTDIGTVTIMASN